MSNRISIAYSVPVQVVVNLEDQTVERVVVIDEEVKPDRTDGGFVEDVDDYRSDSLTDDDVERAYKIAEDGAPWPSWDFGW